MIDSKLVMQMRTNFVKVHERYQNLKRREKFVVKRLNEVRSHMDELIEVENVLNAAITRLEKELEVNGGTGTARQNSDEKGTVSG